MYTEGWIGNIYYLCDKIIELMFNTQYLVNTTYQFFPEIKDQNNIHINWYKSNLPMLPE